MKSETGEKRNQYDLKMKLKAVAMARQKGITRTLTFFDVRRDTLRKWMNNGVAPPPPRVADPEMEKDLQVWYREMLKVGVKLTREQITIKAH